MIYLFSPSVDGVFPVFAFCLHLLDEFVVILSDFLCTTTGFQVKTLVLNFYPVSCVIPAFESISYFMIDTIAV